MTRLEITKKHAELKSAMWHEGVIEGEEADKKRLRSQLIDIIKSCGCELYYGEQVWFTLEHSETEKERFYIGRIEKSFNETWRRYTLQKDYLPYSIVSTYNEEGYWEQLLSCEGLFYQSQQDFEDGEPIAE
jgi:hypothetical protein